MRRVLCLGGSLTLGVRATRGYPEHLWEALGEGWQVVNCGYKGATAVGVLRVAHWHLQSRHDWDLVVIMVGTADAKGGGVPYVEFKPIVKQLASLCTSHAPTILCVPPPVTQSNQAYNRHSRRWLRGLPRAFTKILPMDRLVILDLSGMPVELLADGVNPSPQGYVWIANAIATTADSWLKPTTHPSFAFSEEVIASIEPRRKS